MTTVSRRALGALAAIVLVLGGARAAARRVGRGLDGRARSAAMAGGARFLGRGVVRHAEIKEVMRDPATYSSHAKATQINDPSNAKALEFVRQMMLNRDRHGTRGCAGYSPARSPPRRSPGWRTGSPCGRGSWLMYDWSNRVIGYQDQEYAVGARASAAGSTDMAKRAMTLRPKPTSTVCCRTSGPVWA